MGATAPPTGWERWLHSRTNYLNSSDRPPFRNFRFSTASCSNFYVLPLWRKYKQTALHALVSALGLKYVKHSHKLLTYTYAPPLHLYIRAFGHEILE